mmetsp:Transcript_21053/g.24395  ORF Transcript_21053/g.24395 Transcript_21053/m.24395 type:complete len:122 (+) Transcript_21053:377-742(+)
MLELSRVSSASTDGGLGSAAIAGDTAPENDVIEDDGGGGANEAVKSENDESLTSDHKGRGTLPPRAAGGGKLKCMDAFLVGDGPCGGVDIGKKPDIGLLPAASGGVGAPDEGVMRGDLLRC